MTCLTNTGTPAAPSRGRGRFGSSKGFDLPNWNPAHLLRGGLATPSPTDLFIAITLPEIDRSHSLVEGKRRTCSTAEPVTALSWLSKKFDRRTGYTHAQQSIRGLSAACLKAVSVLIPDHSASQSSTVEPVTGSHGWSGEFDRRTGYTLVDVYSTSAFNPSPGGPI